MARVRDLNPGFFLDDELAELSPLHRLLFEGLWCLADKEGRLEDRPKRIKPQVLPYDACDIEEMLDHLHAGTFIYRYETDGVKCIGIPKFKRYQRIHWKEAESVLPPCLDQAWVKLESTTGHAWFINDSSKGSGTGTGTGTVKQASSKDEERTCWRCGRPIAGDDLLDDKAVLSGRGIRHRECVA